MTRYEKALERARKAGAVRPGHPDQVRPGLKAQIRNHDVRFTDDARFWEAVDKSISIAQRGAELREAPQKVAAFARRTVEIINSTLGKVPARQGCQTAAPSRFLRNV